MLRGTYFPAEGGIGREVVRQKSKGVNDETEEGESDRQVEEAKKDRVKGASLLTEVREEDQAIAMRWGLVFNALRFADLVRRFRTRFRVCDSIPLSRHRLLCMQYEAEGSLTGFVERPKGGGE